MRFAVLVFSLLIAVSSVAQTHKAHKASPPTGGKPALPAVSDSLLVVTLTNQVIQNSTTDSLKALAIYRWVTIHIQYDNEELKKSSMDYSFMPKVPDNLGNDEYKAWHNGIVVLHALKTGKAVCDGYARLYKDMCDAAHIECALVVGWGRVSRVTPGYTPDDTKSNHAWNAIRINGSWHLLDACWGGPDNNYAIGLFYFCTPPEQFIYDHYPEEAKWALMLAPPSMQDFFANPVIYPGYFTSGVKTIFPHRNTIKGAPGTEVNFRIVGANHPVYPMIVKFPGDSTLAYRDNEAKMPVKLVPYNPEISKHEKDNVDAMMAYANSGPAPDTTAAHKKDASEDFTVSGNTVAYKYTLPKEGVNEIIIYVNGEEIASYDVVIEQPK